MLKWPSFIDDNFDYKFLFFDIAYINSVIYTWDYNMHNNLAKVHIISLWGGAWSVV